MRHRAIVDRLCALAGGYLFYSSSGFLAARSEQVGQQHLGWEQTNPEWMPEEQDQERTAFYRQKGLLDEAAVIADRFLKDSAAALKQLARLEPEFEAENLRNSLREGPMTGIATGSSAVFPPPPYLFLSSRTAVGTAIGYIFLAHFSASASQVIFTGQPALRTSPEMFVVGIGVTLVTVLLGQLLGLHS